MLSKNEATGEVAAKHVIHTSIRAHITTLKLTFSDGSMVETTSEHPLYAEGKGFIKAGEIGIGTSIVTRAGPSLRVVKVEKDVRSATVYNFTVQNFHTYFVGDAALWVHNSDACNIGQLTGSQTKVAGDEATMRSLTRENESVDTLLANGYGIHQNPPKVEISPGKYKKPDYFLKGDGIPEAGAYFDCYAPGNQTPVENVIATIAGKVNNLQADGIVLNLKDSSLTLPQIEAAIRADLATPDGGSQLAELKQILVIGSDGSFTRFFPFP